MTAPELGAIPPMDDPLGRYWEQPRDIRLAPMDDRHVLLTAQQRASLLEYSTTMPSGVYPGKCWRRQERDRDLLVWYGITDGRPDLCSIEFREILVVVP